MHAKKLLVLMLSLIVLIGCVVGMSSCKKECEHEWIEATCTEPKHCQECDEAEGDPLGHTWVPATCTDAKHCETCGEVAGDPLGHIGGEATCTDAAICDRCEENYGEALGHTPIKDEGKAPTCTEDGITEGSHCSVCNEILVEQETVKATGHSYESSVTPPTCTSEGYTTYVCPCGDIYVDDRVDPIDHTYGGWTVVKAPTCTESGEERRYCECGNYETKITVALGHDYESVVIVPTCTEQGYTTHTCNRLGCSHVKVDSYVAALGHDYETKVTAPTCTAKGYTTYTCFCGHSYINNYVDALGHSFGEWSVENAPTCTVDGVERRDCENCDHYETRKIGATGHSYESKVTAPTCTEKGYTTYNCSCGHSYVDNYVDATGHKYESKVTSPTCTEQGYTTYTCSVCGDSYVDSKTPALNHDFGEWQETEGSESSDETHKRVCERCGAEQTGPHDYTSVVTAPTCTEQGYTTHTCVCGYEFVDSYVAALGHSFGDWTETKAPKCEEAGEAKRVCSVCEHSETKQIPATGHSYTITVTPPTCEDKGYTTHSCECGKSYVDSFVDATGHTYGEWSVENKPTCTKDGNERRDCESCDHYETKVIEAPGHSYESVVTAPTCTEQGFTTYTCSACDSTYVDDYVRANGHYYESAVTPPTCTEQGYTTYICSACEDTYVDDYVTALGHSFGDWSVVKSATCTEDGSKRRECSVCFEKETDDIPATGHDLTSFDAKDPTCTEPGHNAYEKCNVCTYTTYEKINALGHDTVIDEAKAPTCTEPGLTAGSHCVRCDGNTIEQQEVSATGHSFGAWETTTAPTCVDKGEKIHYCENAGCEESETEELAALGHAHVATVTAPTCTDKGYTTYTCTRCADTYTDNETAALGHTGGLATCTNKAKCTVCGNEYGDTLDHDMVAATCTTDAHCADCEYVEEGTAPGHTGGVATCTTLAKCSVCDASYGELADHAWIEADCISAKHCDVCGLEEGAPLGHKGGKATCTSLAECDVCGVEYGSFAPHDFTAEKAESYYLVSEATCTDAAEYHFACSACGAIGTETYEYGSALGHDYAAWKSNNDGTHSHECNRCENLESENCGGGAATCTTPAVCSSCNEYYGESLGHSWNAGEVTTSATCTKDGVKTYTCTTCQVTNTESVPATGHSYKATVTAPTCTEQGYTTHECENGDCEDSYVTDYKPAAGHSWNAGETTTAPTCTETGIKTFTCNICGETRTEIISATGHSFGEWETTTPATCTKDGVSSRSCTNSECDETETKAIVATGHSYNATTTDATCTEHGYITYACNSCDDVYTVVNEDDLATGHDWKVENDTPAGCITTGVATYICKVDGCDGTKTEITDPVGHSFGEWQTTTPATCTKDGEERRDCDNCDHYEVNKLEATGHSYKETTTDATCTEHGYITGVCTCGDSYTIVNENELATGHDWKVETDTPAGCITTGVVTYTCQVDGCDGTKTEITDPVGHSFGEWYVHTAPTCTEEGEERCECDNCDYFEIKKIDAIGHDYAKETTDPTCVAEGYTTYTCRVDRCNHSYVGDKLPANGHSWNILAPTCTEDQKCSECDEVNEATGHSYGEPVVTPATCASAENRHYECENCDHSYDESVGSPLAHNVEGVTPVLVLNEGETCKYTEHYECKDCKADVIGKEVVKHENYTAVITTPATCKDEGIKTLTCSACGEEKTESIPADTVLGHAWNDGEKSGNVITYTCTICGQTKEVIDASEDTSADVNADDLKNEISLKDANLDFSGTEGIEGNVNIGAATMDDETKNEIFGDNQEALDQVGSNPIYNFTITDENEEDIAFGGKVTITLPYTLEEGEDVDSIAVWYIDDNGKLTSIKATYSNGYVTFETDHFSFYTVTRLTPKERCELYGHNFSSKDIEATCTEAGYTLKYCIRCGHSEKEYAEGAEPLGHNYTSVTNAATCTTAGKVIYMCSGCDSSYTETIAPTGHSYNDGVITKAPTCTTAGIKLYSCANCTSTKRENIAPTGHSYGEGVVKAPTCTAQGYTTYSCNNDGCNHSNVADYVPATGHSYTESTTAPSCTQEGYTAFTCSVCAHSYVGNTVPANGHTWNEGSVTKAPGCTTTGVITYSCTVDGCSGTKTEIIKALGHSYESAVTAPTCTVRGYTTYTCANCAHSYVASYVKATGHKYAAVSVTAPTCTAKGYTTYACEHGCDSSYVGSYVDAVGHTWDEGTVTVDPTCTTTGVRTLGCTIDGCDGTKTEIVKAIGHAYAMEETAPTCTSRGYTTFTCTNGVCGHSYVGEYTAITDHTYSETEVVAPTCITKGYTVYTCSVCRDSYRDNYVDEGEHTYVGSVTAPTCSTLGYTTYTCSVCLNYYVDDYVKTVPHSYIETVTEPTCDEAGYTSCVCENCNDTYTDSFTPAIGHDYKETWQWSEDRGHAHITIKCEHERCHHHTAPHEVDVTANHTFFESTCSTQGRDEYVVNFEFGGKTFSDKVEVKRALGKHNFHDDYQWNKEYHWFKCSGCSGNSDKISHEFDEGTVIKAASCIFEGEILYTCECGYTKTEKIAKNNDHTAGKEIHHNADGHWNICVSCGTALESVAHVWDSGKVTVQATCTETGIMTYRCACGETVTEVIPTNDNHNYSLGLSFDETSHWGECTREGCGNKNAVAEHEYSEWKITVPATCTEIGHRERKCACGYTDTEEIPVIEHSNVSVYDDVSHWLECRVCGEKTDMSEHDHKTLVSAQAPTCSEDGYEINSCECGHVEHTVLPATGIHENLTLKYDDKVHWVQCDCGELIDAEEHSFDYENGAVIKAPTCTEDGLVHVSCECGYGVTEEIPATGVHIHTDNHLVYDEKAHWYLCDFCGAACDVTEHEPKEEIVKAPTCVEPGEKRFACECGYYTTDEIPATGEHVYENGKCKECGAVEIMCDHELKKVIVDLGELGFCGGTVIYYSCECGENTYAEDNFDVECDNLDYVSEDQGTDENGNMWAEVEMVCSDCGLHVYGYATIVQDGCTETYNIEYIFSDAEGNEFLKVYPTDSYTNHGKTEKAEIGLKDVTCGTELYVYRCTKCGEVTEIDDFGDMNCNFEQKEDYEYDENGESIKAIQTMTCTECGLVIEIVQGVTYIDECTYKIYRDLNIYVNGEVFFEYSEEERRTEHDYERTYEMHGQTCADGVTITETCRKCGESYSWRDESHRTMSEEFNTSELGMCPGWGTKEVCEICGTVTNIRVDSSCSFEIVYVDEETGVEISKCIHCSVERHYGYVESEKDENCYVLITIVDEYCLNGELIINASREERYQRHNHFYVYELVGKTCSEGVIVHVNCYDCSNSYEYRTYSHPMYEYAELDLSEFGICGGFIVGNRCLACGCFGNVHSLEIGCEISEDEILITKENVDGIDYFTMTAVCPSCGLTITQQEWNEYNGESECESWQYTTITLTLGDVVVLNSRESNYMSNHDYRTEIKLYGDDCENGYEIVYTCQTCGHSFINEGWGHEFEYHHVEIPCGGFFAGDKCTICNKWYNIKTGDIMCDQSGMVTDSYEENGIRYDRMHFTCTKCGYIYTVLHWISDEGCVRVEGNRIFINDGAEDVLDYSEIYREINHNYETNYEFKGETCEEGYVVHRICTVCGESSSYSGYGHNTEYNVTYLSEHGLCGGTVETYRCVICDTVTSSTIYDNCSWRESYDVTLPTDVPLNMYMFQGYTGNMLYLDGGVNGRYLTTTTDPSLAITIYAEQVEGGYAFYHVVDEMKHYIYVGYNEDGKRSVSYNCDIYSVFNYYADGKAWVTVFEGTEYFIGTYNTFETVSISSVKYINAENTGVSQFPLEIAELEIMGESKVTCSICGAEKVVTTETVWNGPCTYETVETVEYYIYGGLVATGTRYFYGNEHEYTYEYIPNGKTCEEGVTVIEICHKCGESNEYTQYGHNIEVAVKDLCEYGIACGGEHVIETCVICGTVTGEYVNENCGWIWGGIIVGDTVAEPPMGMELIALINQGNTGNKLYLDGGVSGRYLTTTTDAASAVMIYVEMFESGYVFYYFSDGMPMYINVGYNADGKISAYYSSESYSGFWYYPEQNAWVTNVDGEEYYLGTYSTYETVSVSKLSYITSENTGISQFPMEIAFAEHYDDGSYTCEKCGTVKKSTESIIALDSCNFAHSFTTDYLVGDAVVLSINQITYYSEHKYVYEFKMHGASCYDGVEVIGICDLCGDTIEDRISKHVLYTIEEFDLTEYGACAGTLSILSCPCGEEIRHRLDSCNMDESSKDEYIDERGNICNTERYRCSACGFTYTANSYWYYESCDAYKTTDYLFEVDGSVIYTYSISDYSHTGHSYEYSYEFMDEKNPNCDFGVIVHYVCTYCGESGSHENYGHKYEHHYEDFGAIGIPCGGWIEYEMCSVCAMTFVHNYEICCNYSYVNTNEEGYQEYVCEACGSQYLLKTERSEKNENCQIYVKETEIFYTKDMEVLRLNSVYSESAHKYVYDVNMFGSSCEDGYTIKGTCVDCGAGFEGTEYGHNLYEQFVITDFTVYGGCAHHSYTHYGCFCGRENQANFDGGNYDYDGKDTYVCPDCGAIVQAVTETEKDGCLTGVRRTITLTIGGEVIHSFVNETTTLEHNFELSASINDGVVVINAVCKGCGLATGNGRDDLQYAELVFDESTGQYVYDLIFTPEESGYYVIYSSANWDTFVELYRVVDGIYNSVWNDDDGGINNNFRIEWHLEAGETYVYRIRNLSGGESDPIPYVLTKGTGSVDCNHSYEWKYVFPDTSKSCEDGVVEVNICTLCGCIENYNLFYHHNQTILESHDLSEYGVCSGYGWIEIRGCICGDNKSLDLSFGCPIEESWEYYTDENGVYHSVCTMICPECGLRIVRDEYNAKVGCMSGDFYTYSVFVGEAEIISEFTYAWSYSYQHNYSTEFVFDTEDRNCESGVTCMYTCTECGHSYEQHYSSHYAYAIDVYYYVNNYGACGSDGSNYIRIRSCACGYSSAIYDRLYDCSMSSEYSYFTDDNGVDHTLYTRVCYNCGLTLVRDEYTAKEGCRYITYRTYTLTIGETVIIGGFDQIYSRWEQHNYGIPGYTFESDINCESGVTIHYSCADCGYGYDEYRNYHSTILNQYIDLSEYGACGGYIEYSECPCGQIGTLNNNSLCGSVKVDDEFYSDENGNNHFRRTFICDDCGLVYVSDRYVVTEGCLRITYSSASYTLDGIDIFSISDVRTSEQTHHDYQYSFVYDSEEENCESGVTVYTTCAYCEYTNEQHYNSHYRYMVDKTYYLGDYGVCGIDSTVRINGCACGYRGTFNDFIANCNMTSYNESYVDEFGETHELYVRTCADCGLTITRDRYNELNGCDYVRYYSYSVSVGDYVVIPEYKYVYTRGTQHTYGEPEFIFDSEANCDLGVTYRYQCQNCEYSYDEYYSHHYAREVERYDLSEYGACYGYISLNECACGAEKYINTDMCAWTHTYNSYYDEEGVYHEVEARTCESCGLRYQDDYTNVKDSSACKRYEDHTVSINVGATLVATINYQREYDDHSYVATGALMEGAVDCEGGVVITRTCRDCGYSYSYECYYHESFEIERFNINEEQYGSALCVGHFSHYGCACGKYNSMNYTSQCEFGHYWMELWIEGAINDYVVSAEYPGNYYYYISSDAYRYTCAVTDPEQCGYSVRYATYWLYDATECRAYQYQTWQFGYDEATGEYAYEITFKTGESTTYHAYDSSDLYEAWGNGNTKVSGTRYDCPNCGSYYYEKNEYSETGEHILSDRLYVNTLEDGNRKLLQRYYEYVNGEITVRLHRYIESDGYEHWDKYEYTRNNDYVGPFGDYGYEYEEKYSNQNCADGEYERISSYAYVHYRGYTYYIYEYNKYSNSWDRHDYTYNFDGACERTTHYTNSDGADETYTESCHREEWTWLVYPTCTQDGYSTYVCVICGCQSGDMITESAYDHNWIYTGGEFAYYCSRCGLENANGASGDIVLEDLTYRYGDGDSYVAGYWARNEVQFLYYVSIILHTPMEDGNDEIILDGIEIYEIENVRALAFSRSAAIAAAEALGYAEGEYYIRFAFVPVGADGSFDYAITFTDHTPGEPQIEYLSNGTCIREGSYDLVVYCTDCGIELSRELVKTGFGDHEFFDATCQSPASCMHCGYQVGEKTDHNWQDADCTNAKWCISCGMTEGLPLGHDFTEATCTAPMTCKVCGVTEGSSLGHIGGEGTCAEPSLCERCGEYYSAKGHTVITSYADGIPSYVCIECGATYTLEDYIYLDGNDTTHFMHLDNYGAYNLSTENGYYEVLNVTGDMAQYQAWIPSISNHDLLSGFTCENNARGFISLSLNAHTQNSRNAGFDMRITSGRGTADWNWGTCAATIFRIDPIKSDDQTTVDIYGMNGTFIKTVEIGEDKFTGWMDIVIGIELNDDYTMDLTYYIDGELLATYSGAMPLVLNKINSVYFGGYTDSIGSGYMLDDFVIGYTPNGTWNSGALDHSHEWSDATCTEAKSCTVCGLSVGYALGHKADASICTEDSICSVCGIVIREATEHVYSEATCTDAMICQACGNTEGEPLGHDFTEATCTDPMTCINCGITEGEALGHIGGEGGGSCDEAPICERCGEAYGFVSHTVTVSYVDAMPIYACDVCGATYTLEDYIYLDGSESEYFQHIDTNSSYSFSTADGYYDVRNITGTTALYSAWIPNGNYHELLSGFTCENNAVGFISFRLNTYSSYQGFDMRIAAGRGTAEWNWSDCATYIFRVDPVNSEDQTTVGIYGINGTYIKTVELGEDKFTGWMDVIIGIELNSDNTIEVTYYIDGELLATYSGVMPIIVNKIQSVYINGRTEVVDSGYMLNDFVIGYASNGSWTPGEPADHEHEWAEATCTDPMTCTVCGRTKGSALGHSTNAATCTESSVCSVCGIVVSEPLGHNYAEATCLSPATCMNCGETSGELGDHVYVVNSCEEPMTCIYCGATDGEAVGHDFAEATCTEPKMCKTCGITDGEALGHIGSEGGSCDTSICDRCGEVIKAGSHSLVVSGYDANVNTMTYSCSNCGAFYTLTGYYMDGTNTDNLQIVNNGADYALNINEAGQYEMLYPNETSDTPAGQQQIWVPLMGNPELMFDFSCANNAIGFLSFKVSCYNTYQNFQVRLNAERGTADWNWGNTSLTVFNITPVKSDDQTTVDITGFNNTLLKSVEIGEDKWTPWLDVIIGIQLRDDNTMILTYTVDGELLGTVETEMVISTGRITSVYINGRTSVQNSGFKFDDLVFGYTTDGSLTPGEPDDHEHEWTEATCTDPMTCTVCGRTSGSAFGHNANEATCTESSVCSVCGIVVCEPLGHNYSEATCLSPASCMLCGETSGELGDHVYVANSCEEPMTCVYCGATNGEAVGHDFADATCTDPKICKACGITDGEPIGHSFAEATCTAPMTCVNCGITKGEALGHTGGEGGETCAEASICERCGEEYGSSTGHSIVTSYDDVELKYVCCVCGEAFGVDNYVYNNGTNADYVFTSNGSFNVTATEEGEYEVKFLPDTAVAPEEAGNGWMTVSGGKLGGQSIFWIPSNGKDKGLQGFSCANNSVGVVSFRMKINADSPITIMATKERAASDWTGWGTSAMNLLTIGGYSEDGITIKGGIGTVKNLATISVGDGWSEWFEVHIFIQLKDDGTISLDYYVNGQLCGSFEGAMPIDTLDIRAVYLSGITCTYDTGYVFDDFVFGCASNS